MIAFSTLFKNAIKPSPQYYELLLECKNKFNNLEEIIDEFFKSNPFLCQLMKKIMTDYEGAYPDQLSKEYADRLWEFYQLCYEHAKHSDNEQFSISEFAWIKGGNSCLVYKLIDQLEGKIHYNAIMQKLAKKNEDSQYQIFFKNGSIVQADYVILALPCSTLRDVDLKESEIPEDQIQAIQNLHFGTNSKMLFPVSFRTIQFLMQDLLKMGRSGLTQTHP